MRDNDKNLTITPYLEYNQLDSSKIKIKEPNHLFDVDPNNRRSNKRPYVDRDNAVSPTRENSPTDIIMLIFRQRKYLRNPVFHQRKHRMNLLCLKKQHQQSNN